MKCRLCRRESETGSSLCRYHQRARAALEEGYRAWKYAYGEMSWTEYLDSIKRNEDTGQWVKEVAELAAGEEPR
jgi:hypothetical protein